MVKAYGLFLARRFFPDKQFETVTGIVGKNEVVTLGRNCVLDNFQIFQLIKTDYFESLMCFQEDVASLIRSAESITEEEALMITEAKKQQLTCGRQLLYFERYDGQSEARRLEGLQGFEFCGFDITDGLCAISFVTDKKNMISKQIHRLNEYGLFDTFEEASAARKQMRDDNPYENMQDATVNAVWRCLKPLKKFNMQNM